MGKIVLFPVAGIGPRPMPESDGNWNGLVWQGCAFWQKLGRCDVCGGEGRGYVLVNSLRVHESFEEWRTV